MREKKSNIPSFLKGIDLSKQIDQETIARRMAMQLELTLQVEEVAEGRNELVIRNKMGDRIFECHRWIEALAFLKGHQHGMYSVIRNIVENFDRMAEQSAINRRLADAAWEAKQREWNNLSRF